MRSRLCAALILTSWTQVRGEEPPVPDPPGREITINVGLPGSGKRRTQELILIILRPPDLADNEDHRPVARRPAMRIDLNSAIMKSENFDLYLFGEETEKERKAHLEALLVPRVRAAVRRRHLDDQQRQKLMLTGRGDIKRFFDQVEDRRSEFEKTKWSIP